LKGDYHWQLGSTVKDFGVRAPLKLPDMLTASLSAPLDSKTTLMVSGRYYGWSSFDALRLHFSTGCDRNPRFQLIATAGASLPGSTA
jgi:long-subunit fatty acid transport protein